MRQSILHRVKKEQAPLIDGNSATFVWLGESAPGLVGDFSGWDEGKPVSMLETEPGVWTYQLTLPMDAYIEYSYWQGEGNTKDPLNRRLSPNGMGDFNNYFSMPDHKHTSLTRKNNRVPHGKVTTHNIATDSLITGKKRTIHLYQPPVDFPAPLLVVWDGQDYLYRVRFTYMIDNLIHQKRIQPLAIAFVENGGQKSRTVEYACSDATLVFLMTSVLPFAQKHLNLVDLNAHPGAYGVTGASMGGLMALYTGARLPQVFGNVLSQSGAFAWGDFDMVVFDLFKNSASPGLKVWMDVGNYDLPGLLDANRRMQELLRQKGYEMVYREYHAGHNYPSWRDDIWRGLEYLYSVK